MTQQGILSDLQYLLDELTIRTELDYRYTEDELAEMDTLLQQVCEIIFYNEE